MTKIKYVEIFHSIQGEGYNYGKPVIFIRLNDCNLNCPWCDTDWKIYEYEFTHEELLNHIKQWDCNNVIITGGEPTKNYENFKSLVQFLKAHDYNIHIETNGLNNIDIENIWISTSPKIMYFALYKIHKLQNKIIKKANEVRIVIDPKQTIEKQIEAMRWFKENIVADHYYLSPCEVNNNFNFDDLATIYNQLKVEGWQISIQLHKLQNIR